jgi:hypothetical protein
MTKQSTMHWRVFLWRDEAQGAVEYLLVIGAIVVVTFAAFMGFDSLVREFVGHVCPSVDTANPLVAVGSCITSAGP